ARLNLFAPVPRVARPDTIDCDTGARLGQVDDAAEIGGGPADISAAVEIGHVRELAERCGFFGRAPSLGVLLDDAAQAGGQVAHERQAAARAATSALRSREATDLASGPVAPSGPTHDGQPDSHGQPSINSRVRASRSSCSENNGSLK